MEDTSLASSLIQEPQPEFQDWKTILESFEKRRKEAQEEYKKKLQQIKQEENQAREISTSKCKNHNLVRTGTCSDVAYVGETYNYGCINCGYQILEEKYSSQQLREIERILNSNKNKNTA